LKLWKELCIQMCHLRSAAFLSYQRIGNLPKARVTLSRSFKHVDIDYAERFDRLEDKDTKRIKLTVHCSCVSLLVLSTWKWTITLCEVFQPLLIDLRLKEASHLLFTATIERTLGVPRPSKSIRSRRLQGGLFLQRLRNLVACGRPVLKA